MVVDGVVQVALASGIPALTVGSGFDPVCGQGESRAATWALQPVVGNATELLDVDVDRRARMLLLIEHPGGAAHCSPVDRT